MDLNLSTTVAMATFNNTTSTPSYHAPVVPLYISIMVTLSYGLVFIAGILGNAMVILVVSLFADMRSSTNIYLANLSIADMLVLLICLPGALSEFHSDDVWHLGDFMCRMTYFVENLVASASVLTIIAVTVDRYIAVCRPLRAQSTCTTTRACKVVAGVWLMSVVSALPFLVTAGTYLVRYDDTYRPRCGSPIDRPWKRIYVLLLSFLFFFIPLGILFLLYLFIGVRVHKESKRFRGDDNAYASHAYKSRHKVIWLLVAIVSLFFICLLPIRVIILLYNFLPYGQGPEKLGLEGFLLVMSFARIMLYSNSACNPIVYSIVSKKYRSAFRRAFSRNCKSNQSSCTGHYTMDNVNPTTRTSMLSRSKKCNNPRSEMQLLKNTI